MVLGSDIFGDRMRNLMGSSGMHSVHALREIPLHDRWMDGWIDGGFAGALKFRVGVSFIYI
jgi:hypothetical protein